MTEFTQAQKHEILTHQEDYPWLTDLIKKQNAYRFAHEENDKLNNEFARTKN